MPDAIELTQGDLAEKKKPAKHQLLRRDTRRILGITVLLTQFPLVFHLPLWLSIPGMLLVLCKTIPTFDNGRTIHPVFMTPLVLLAAFGTIWHYGDFLSRDPCVAFLFLLIGFKFSESTRKYDASLLIVLCAFLLLTQFFYWQSISAAIFTLPALFFIGLSLFSLQRDNAHTSNRQMVNITATLFSQAIPIAMLLFLAIPRLSTPGWGNGDGKAVTGLSSRMSPGSVAELSKSNEVAFRVEFDSKIPLPHQLYWRGPVLTGFDGTDWFIQPSINKSAYSPGRDPFESEKTLINYTVTMEPTYNPWLLALDTPISLPKKIDSNGLEQPLGRIDVQRQLISKDNLVRPTRYRMSSKLTDRFTTQTVPSASNLYIANTNPQSREFASRLRSGSTNDRLLVNRILQFFNQEQFHYTLNPPQLGPNSIDDFLFSTRRGFCEHYAGSLVFLLRAAGIPARVVTGYQGGELNGDYMIVRQSDAHAWAEAFIDNQWQRFDPTAAVAPQRVERGMAATLGNESFGLLQRSMQWPWVKSIGLHWDATNYAWQRFVIGFDEKSQQGLWKKIGLGSPSGVLIAVVLALAAALWILLIVVPASLIRKPRVSPCEKQWQRLCKKFAHHGYARNAGESATDYIERLGDRWPQHQRKFKKILKAYHLGLFSQEGQQPQAHQNSTAEMKQQISRIGKLT
ncbi:hypothetical protein AB833_15970 [Chromatiales bacterium (ex Bugula neritina AB1)]|nr:hypothetical protein AB833_15970 [Chromatiales bacterium (ex Bugula neritina AB1)]